METLAFDNPAAGHMRALTRAPAFAQDEYLALLRRHLHAEPDHEIRFFANSRRFAILETLIGERIEKRFETMLNVACGPFAFENYLRPPEHLSIDAFDIWPELSALLRDMRERGRMGNIRFRVSDVGAYETPRSYDLVLINDLFYIRALDFFEHVGRYAAMLKPGGVLYFDLLDRRAGWLWRLAGRDGRYARYDLDEVFRHVRSLGLEVEAVVPSMGIRDGAHLAARKLAYKGLGVANNFIFVARKP